MYAVLHTCAEKVRGMALHMLVDNETIIKLSIAHKKSILTGMHYCTSILRKFNALHMIQSVSNLVNYKIWQYPVIFVKVTGYSIS